MGVAPSFVVREPALTVALKDVCASLQQDLHGLLAVEHSRQVLASGRRRKEKKQEGGK